MAVKAWVGTLRASNGTTYVLTLDHDDEEHLDFWHRHRMTPHEYQERWKAEYDAACWNAFFNKVEGPCFTDYNSEKYPNE